MSDLKVKIYVFVYFIPSLFLFLGKTFIKNGGVVQDKKGLFYSNAQELSTLGINMRLEHEVLRIDFDQKKI
ncbi:MAG: hypothetical protein Q8778_02585, partial [Sweet potato little leaf phytoplasma]|nr:hypothetical protein [Sweet potato little leaf phytoplasma]